ncbi:hypothetical protein [Sorangium sp. So ce1099]|uniref:hypothetical protein n=1 Tax=Sorangium sp. So ce1099 TaxID=3133331 RepID=UPI003F5DD4B3
MSRVSAATLELAENLNLNCPQRAGEERVVRPGYAAIVGAEADPHHNVVQRLRLARDEVAATVAEVRAIFAAKGRRRITWEVGDHAEPNDLAERLIALGMKPFAPDDLAVGMVLTRPLESMDTSITVRRVQTFEEFARGAWIFRRGFGSDDAPEDDPEIVLRWTEHRSVSVFERYLAFDGDEAIAVADALFLDAGVVMCGGATIASARGRGAYRALITARWEEGRRRGTPTLITQAGAMSRPILKRLGFEEVVQIRIFLDELA